MSVWILIIAQSLQPREAPSTSSNVALGLIIFGIIVLLAVALAYVLGRRRGELARARCPNCGAPKRGEFCARCGTQFE